MEKKIIKSEHFGLRAATIILCALAIIITFIIMTSIKNNKEIHAEVNKLILNLEDEPKEQHQEENKEPVAESAQ